MIAPEQIEEWTENPVTLELLGLLKNERDELQGAKGLGAFHPFDAHKTQEVLANLNGAVDTLELIIAALEGQALWELDDEE